MPFLDTAKQYFETNDKPTQAQFWWTLDRLRWNDQTIPMNAVSGLIAVLNGLANPVEVFEKPDDETNPWIYKIPAGYLLEKIIVQPSVDCTIKLFDDQESQYLIEDEEVLINKSVVWVVNVHAIYERIVNIETLPQHSKITVIKRNIIP